MRFKEWEDRLTKVHNRAKELLVDEEILSETFEVDGHEIKIFLGDDILFSIDGEPASIWPIKARYQAGNKVWVEALGSLGVKVTLAELLNPKLLDAAVQSYLKEAVLDRLTGDNDIPDNKQIIINAAEKRMKKLERLIPKVDFLDSTVGFPLPSPSENYPLVVWYRSSGDRPSIDYGSSSTSDIKSSWSLLSNYEQIEATVKEFADLMRPVIQLCKKAKGV